MRRATLLPSPVPPFLTTAIPGPVIQQQLPVSEGPVARQALLVHDPHTKRYWWQEPTTHVLVRLADQDSVARVSMGDYSTVPYFLYDAGKDLIHEVRRAPPSPVPTPPDSADSSVGSAGLDCCSTSGGSGAVTTAEQGEEDSKLFSSAKKQLAALQEQVERLQNRLEGGEHLPQEEVAQQSTVSPRWDDYCGSSDGGGAMSSRSSTPACVKAPLIGTGTPPTPLRASGSLAPVPSFVGSGACTSAQAYVAPHSNVGASTAPSGVLPSLLRLPVCHDAESDEVKSTSSATKGNGPVVSKRDEAFGCETRKRFENDVSNYVESVLDRYRIRHCPPIGRITTESDFKYLAKKLTRTILVKEERAVAGVVEKLKWTEKVQRKAEKYIVDYMKKFGTVFRRP